MLQVKALIIYCHLFAVLLSERTGGGVLAFLSFSPTHMKPNTNTDLVLNIKGSKMIFDGQISTFYFSRDQISLHDFAIIIVSLRKLQFCRLNLHATGSGFPPREDLRLLLGPDGIPVKDCLLFVLSLVATGDFI